jgi:hypothetical protein
METLWIYLITIFVSGVILAIVARLFGKESFKNFINNLPGYLLTGIVFGVTAGILAQLLIPQFDPDPLLSVECWNEGGKVRMTFENKGEGPAENFFAIIHNEKKENLPLSFIQDDMDFFCDLEFKGPQSIRNTPLVDDTYSQSKNILSCDKLLSKLVINLEGGQTASKFLLFYGADNFNQKQIPIGCDFI